MRLCLRIGTDVWLSGPRGVLARWMRLTAALHAAHVNSATSAVTFSFPHVKAVTYLLAVNGMGHEFQLGAWEVRGLVFAAFSLSRLAPFALSSCLPRTLDIRR